MIKLKLHRPRQRAWQAMTIRRIDTNRLKFIQQLRLYTQPPRRNPLTDFLHLKHPLAVSTRMQYAQSRKQYTLNMRPFTPF